MKDYYKEGKLESMLLSYRIYSLKELKNVLTIYNVLKFHKDLNLSLLSDYDSSDYEEYITFTEGTTDELVYEEFKILKEWQDE